MRLRVYRAGLESKAATAEPICEMEGINPISADVVSGRGEHVYEKGQFSSTC